MPQSDVRHDVQLDVDLGRRSVEISAYLREGGETMLLCLHGLGCAKESFSTAFAARELSDLAICAFDFPGHGCSEWLPPGAYSLELYADVALGVIRRLRPRRVVLVGHSMGGAVGLIMAQNGIDLASFVSVEGNLMAEDCGLISRQAAERPLKVFIERDLPDLRASLAASPRIDLQRWAGWYSLADPVAVHQAAGSLVSWSDSGKLFDMFTALDAPAYVYGEDSGDLTHVLSRLDGVPTYRVGRSGHFPMLDNPGELWQIVSAVAVPRFTVSQ